MTIERDHGKKKNRRRVRRSRDKRGAEKLTPMRVSAAEKRRLKHQADLEDLFAQD